MTEPILNCLPNVFRFKIHEIFAIFKDFNVFLKNCNEKGINLSELKLSDIYVTEKYELKILSKYYYLDILRNIKQQKLNEDENIPPEKLKNPKNNSKKSEIYLLGKILYYLYYCKYPQKNEKEFPKCEVFSDLIKKCLKTNINDRLSYEEYFNHPFFHPKIVFPNSDKEKIIPFKLYKSYNEEEINFQKCEGINYESKMNNSTYYYLTNILDERKNILLHIEDKNKGFFHKLKNSKNKNLYLFIGLYTLYIIKKNSETSFSLVQEIKNTKNEKIIYHPVLLELSSGDLAFIKETDKEKKYVSIFSKVSENKFQESLVIDEMKEPIDIYETEDNFMIISSKEESLFFDVKKGLKKIRKENKNNEYMFINSKFYFEYGFFCLLIYNNEYDEQIYKLEKDIYCIKRLQDGTYLLGGRDNDIYQIFFDKFGNPELVCVVDSGYGTFEDDDDFAFSPIKPYGVGKIEQFENGDIITYSFNFNKAKLWKLNK